MLMSFEQEFAKIEAEYYANPRDELIARISEPHAKTIIWGAGAVGRMVAKTIADKASNFIGFCDSYKQGVVNEFSKRIFPPEQIADEFADAVIIVATSNINNNNNDIYKRLLDMKFPMQNIFRRHSGYELYNIEEFKVNHYEGYNWAYDFFEDEHSKRIVLSRMKQYLFYFESEHEPISEQYFDSEIHLTESEVFVDGGCYIGDTALDFIKRANGKFSGIIGFEPDAQNYADAVHNLSGYANIFIVNKGLYSTDTTMFFSADNGGSSQITDNGQDSIQTVALDNFLYGGAYPLPTYIKLDIEGAEQEAVLGMKNTISTLRPKLAISVYHKPEDLYKIPQMLSQLGAYKMFLKHYTPNLTETVLYAISQ
jgi:FkbM family methyltransferase